MRERECEWIIPDAYIKTVYGPLNGIRRELIYKPGFSLKPKPWDQYIPKQDVGKMYNNYNRTSYTKITGTIPQFRQSKLPTGLQEGSFTVKNWGMNMTCEYLRSLQNY